MMGVKGGTQTWSSAPQRADYKSDGAQTISASDKDKFFGDEAIGDTLNKVADPNYIDGSKKLRAVGNSELGKDAFMTLLLTQMKNQDPTSPLKSHEMAAQLAQFTSLEKLNNINDGINNLRKDNQPDHNFQALAMIGKVVTMDNTKINRTDTNASHELRFSLATDAPKCNLEVKDAEGNVVRKLELKNLKAGGNEMMWNGKTEDGSVAPAGDYSLAVEAFGSNGKKIQVQTKAEGLITGVNFTAHGAQLLMGKQVISMSDVKSITDPAAGAAQQMMQPQTTGPAGPTAGGGGHAFPIPSEAAAAQGPKKVEVKPETKANEAKRASMKKGTLADVPMSQGLINTLNKEGAKAGGMQGS